MPGPAPTPSERQGDHAISSRTPEPLYGIDRAAVDAQLEIERLHPRGTATGAPDHGITRHHRPSRDERLGQMPVERERVRAVIHDHQRAKPGKWRGVRD